MLGQTFRDALAECGQPLGVVNVVQGVLGDINIPIGTLMSRIHRGRERLRGLMSDFGDDCRGGEA